jgi:hypothetical protein
MLSNILRSSALAAVFMAGSMATAQQPVPVPTGSVPAQQVGNHYRAKQILGSSITIQNNTAIGIVDDIVFDEAGNLEYLIVNNDGKLSTVPFEAAQFNVEKKTAIVNITPEQYKVIPTYTTTTYPSFYTPEYRTAVYKQYNLTPRQLRVLERRNR